MSDDLPFSRYSEPYLNPFPDPHPEEPRPREEREAEKKGDFTPPFVPSRLAGEKPEASQSQEPLQETATQTPQVTYAVQSPQAEEKFDEEFNEDVFKLGVKIVVFAALVIAVGFLFWFFMKDERSEPEPFVPVTTEKTISYTDDEGKIVEIIVPEGALKEDVKIEIEKIAKGAVTNKYQFTPKGLKFLRPVIVKIPYKENGLKKGETPHDIKLEYQARPGDQKYLLWYEVDENAKKLVTQVMGF